MKPVSIYEELRGNSYPGRGIVIGKSGDGRCAVTAYFIMGRSVNSRNRVFVAEGEDMRTQTFDPALLSDPSLVIYFPVRMFDGGMIVTNGDQTDTISDGLRAGKSYIEALRTRCFEPDPPIYTPRVSGVLEKDGSYCLSILKSLDGDPACNKRFFFEYDAPRAGMGHFIHTYNENQPTPPSFEGEPRAVELGNESADELAASVWQSLNADNKVSLYVCTVDLASGDRQTAIINKNK